MKKLPLLNTLLLIGIIAYLVVNAINFSNEEEEVYIVTGELHQNFDYQKELNEEFLKIKESKNGEVNFFIEKIKTVENRINSGNYIEEDLYNYEVGLNQLQKLQQDTEIELSKINGEYNLKIWEKLNNYIESFGKEKNYTIIFGAGGDGNIMYAKDAINVTEEVTNYCNQKYNGK